MRSLTFLVAVVLLSESGVAFAQAQPAVAQPATPDPATTTAAPTPADAEPQVVAPADIVQPDPTPAAQLLLPAPPTAAAELERFALLSSSRSAALLDAYRAEALDIRFTPFGWKGFELRQNGQEVTGSYADVFAASSPEALDKYEGARRMAAAGSVLMVIGIAAVVAGAVLVPSTYSDTHSTALAWGLLGGGFAVELLGGILTGVGAQRFNDAVDLHNDALYDRLRATAPATAGR